MSWFRLLRHDLRAGLLRRRYLAVPLLFAVGCFLCRMGISGQTSPGSWMDYILFCFKGMRPLTGASGFELPIGWFLIFAGSLFLQLDYLLEDLTEAGQQVIVRTGSRRSWYLSKCLWNLLTCGFIMALGLVTALVFALASGGSAELTNTGEVTMRTLGVYVEAPLTVAQALWIGVALPYLTVAAFSQLQMTLCLFCKPIISFLATVSLLVASLLFSTPWLPGNGAQTCRSALLGGSLEPWLLTAVCMAVLLGSVIAGVIRFDRMDLLRYEE